ncbi:HNH/endonuclease VII fold putative polymorphic toxin [Bacillus aquiflavi]|uniref:HNH/endonuclease VII fold putative polymorphic toxin n=1 Tax=Bacillus aquiflavi TaxID=2672567 RepID=UPI001FEA371B|nr:HNH/endonuclease VII fold putative polymorphic toxin [Bacillus aquiflavi]
MYATGSALPSLIPSTLLKGAKGLSSVKSPGKSPKVNNSKPYSKEFIQEKINAAKAGMGKVKVPVLYREQLSTGYSSLPIVGMGTKPLGEIRPQMFSVKSEGREKITKDTVNLNRKKAFNKAKDLAGIPRSQQPSRQWQVGDNVYKKGGDYKNYEYSLNPTHHGRYYEYDTPQGKRVIVEHINDGRLHTHAGKPKDGANPFEYDFKKERYSNIYGPNGDHHIYYNR